MALLTLPTRTDLRRYSFQAELQGSLFNFEFYWNVREAAWYFNLSDAATVPIVSGRKVVADWPLLRGVADSRRPKGEVLALDTTGGGEPGLSDLGGRVQLVYREG